jgi:hypothetical protein
MDAPEFVGAGDAEPAVRPGGGAGCRVIGCLKQAENVPGFFQIGLAYVGQADLAGGAGEKARAEAGLQRVDATRGGGGAEVQPARSAREAAFLGNSDEDFKALEPVQDDLLLCSFAETKTFN